MARLVLLSLISFLTVSCSGERALQRRAERLVQDFVVVDTHIDVPYRLQNRWEDIGGRTGGNFDYPRAKAGGLDAAFMSIYVPAALETTGTARAFADTLIDMVEAIAASNPDKFEIVTTPSDVVRVAGTGRIAFCLGMENGAPVEGKMENLKHFHDRGVRYITLAHSEDNHICDSSYDTTRTWEGLSPFGRSAVLEMNRLGIMVDVSHISDDAFDDVMEVSTAPVIASHSSCRHFTPDWERNLSDDMIRRLAAKGGVVMINFGSSFLKDDSRRAGEARWNAIEHFIEENHLRRSDSLAVAFIEAYAREHPYPYADVRHVVDHMDHVVRLVGVNHVGFGSDFDGVGDSLPVGLKDVSQYPNIVRELLRRGYASDDIRKICGENLLRVWSQVEQVARVWK
jgi:membrane dipeptidase